MKEVIKIQPVTIAQARKVCEERGLTPHAQNMIHAARLIKELA